MDELHKELSEMRARANAVLDGFVKYREKVARDCLRLCDTVERLNRVAKERGAQKDDPLSKMFKDIFP